MTHNEIYEKLATYLCLALIYGDNESYQDYKAEYKKYNITIKPEPYSKRITEIMKKLDDKKEEYGLDHILREVFRRNRGSWEREQFAIRMTLKELTTIGVPEKEEVA
jgi:hypothetical protein